MVASIDGILKKIDNPSLGMALGFAVTELSLDQSTGGSPFQYLQYQIGALMKQPHIPSLGHIMSDLSGNGPFGQVFKGGIMAGIGGWLLDEIDMNPTISSLGRTLKTLGINAALGAIAADLLDKSGLNYSDGGAPAGQPYGGHNGYPKGAGYSPLGRRNGGYFTMPNVVPATPTLPTILPASPRP